MGHDIALIFIEDGRVESLISSSSDDAGASLSPDGNWIAYESDESGQFEIYVQSFPDVDTNKFRVSAAGGTYPVWARDGEELYYVEGGSMVSVPVQTDPTFVLGVPEPLFPTDAYFFRRPYGRSFDVAPDGRFLMIKIGGPEGRATPPQINVVLNWFQELTERVPVP